MTTLDPTFRPSKKLGQNFLTNESVVERIALAGLAHCDSVDRIIEIGPGKGVLTKYLLSRSNKPVTAIEKDKRLYEYLCGIFSAEIASGALTLINDDALKFPLPNEKYAIIANIPYSITSPLIDHFIRDTAMHTDANLDLGKNVNTAAPNMPTYAVLLVQKEVAEKVAAKAPHMNVLALHVQTFAQVKYLFKVSAGNFSPAPKVDSAVIEITTYPQTEATNAHDKEERYSAINQKVDLQFDYKKYFGLIHAAFSQKRKMLSSTVGKELCLKAGIDPTRRPETLSVDEWKKLAS